MYLFACSHNFLPLLGRSFHTTDQFPCNCALNFCYGQVMLTLKGGGEFRWLGWLMKVSKLPVSQKLLHNLSVMQWATILQQEPPVWHPFHKSRVANGSLATLQKKRDRGETSSGRFQQVQLLPHDSNFLSRRRPFIHFTFHWSYTDVEPVMYTFSIINKASVHKLCLIVVS